VQADVNAPKWGLSETSNLSLHYDGAEGSKESTHIDLLVRCGARQAHMASGFAPAWRTHGTEAAYLVPIDSAPGTFDVCTEIGSGTLERKVDVSGRVS
jgi:hypothetical protein